MVKEEIMQEVEESVQFSVIIDETKDVQKKRANVNCSEILLEWSDSRELSRISRGKKS